MAETSYPFDNQDSTETQWSNIARLVADTGVLGSPNSTELKPYADATGMNVKVPIGSAMIRGFYYNNDAVNTLTVPAASASNRVDTVVLRLDPTANTIIAAVKQGTPGAGTGPGLVISDTGVLEVPLADVNVPANATTITASNIVDRRTFSSQEWGSWTTATRPPSAREGKAGYNYTLRIPEFFNGSGWQPIAQQTTDAGTLSTGTLANARLDYGVLAAVRGDRQMDAPLNADVVNGDWNAVLQPGVYRIFSGSTNTNAPANAYMYGTLVVFGAGQTISSRTQMYVEHGGNGQSYLRTAWNGTDWNAWQQTARMGDVNLLRSDSQAADNALSARVSAVEGRRRLIDGTGTVTSFTYDGTANYSGYATIDYTSAGFTSPPKITASADSIDSGGVVCMVPSQYKTNTNARIYLVRRNNFATGFDWHASGA